MQKLITGVHQFQKEIFAKQRSLFEKLAHGQKPSTLFITCSDSRISPSVLTQTQPGEIFILRNAGNIIPSYQTGVGGETATIEYAIAALRVADIVVCGHSHCGAMKALLDPVEAQTFPAMTQWLRHADATRRIVRENYKNVDTERLLNITVQENVLAQIDNLRTHPSVAAGLARGELRIHAWVYKFESGQVFAYNPDEGQFMTLDHGPVFEGVPRQLAETGGAVI